MSSTQNSLEAGDAADAGARGEARAPGSSFLSQVAFDGRGLVVVVAQDDASGEVLMVAWANGEALTRTLETGFGHYFSRSRNNLWKKGETSGHVQRVVSVHLDCDGDTVIYRVEQEGPACHTGAPTCFFRVWDGKAWVGSAESPAPCPGGSAHGGHSHGGHSHGEGVTRDECRHGGGADGEPA